MLANTEESKNIHFNLRYQIYCIEKGYEQSSKFKDGLETDEYDESAAHFLIRHKANHEWVGTFRLIIDKFGNLPICQHAHIEHAHRVSTQKTVVEFSRLAILRSFQKLNGKTADVIGHSESCLVFNAISAGIEYSRRLGAHRIYFFCKPSLTKMVRKMGFKYSQIGDKTQFRGVRFPYQLDLSNFPLHLFETPQALHRFQRKNAYIHYCQASVLDDRQKQKLSAAV